MNTPQSYNLLNYLYDDVITVTRQMSRQVNFSLHAKINDIEFEDIFFDKTHANKKYFVRRLLKEFSYKQGKKRTKH